MRLLALTLLTLCAFAANSILTRAALTEGAATPLVFAALRVASGAAMLVLLLRLQGRPLPPPRPGAVLALAAYMLGFSLAYLDLAAGAGALILFGGVQITMFAGAALMGEDLPPRRIAGAALAFAGLVWLMLPAAGAVPGALPAALMLVAALGWGLYSLAGKSAADPLAATASNFLWTLPLVALPLLWTGAPSPSPTGWLLALTSGAVTSGLGYALWYALLPQLGAARAAVAQLAVPVIALIAGALLLAERPAPAALAAATLVLAGVALASRSPR
ncbi:DMT family transporter [Gemmobacter caeruleus]|uniref:DMT family transporter n=1 Tax=Gemmobacter caeruleus TaxID=2595004 RepID=UPI0011ECB840|nr:DMT family transporter [Gemmobacter caeruleus]